ncbi:MAG: hypothetical protein IJF42_02040 [Clostridia bacterium]|nr:hypothetical protein [Clostridia bacterium]
MLKHRRFLWSFLAGVIACCMLTACLSGADDAANSTSTTTSTTATTTTTASSNSENDGADAAYAPFLKEWRQVSHWWRNGAEYFSVERWRIQMTDAGLMGYYGASPYVAVEDVGDVGDSIAFEYNGKHFTRFGGGGFEAVLEKESDTVLVGHNVDDEKNTVRFVLDPENETLTVTQLDADGVLATIVYDTKMSVESGVFVDKGDLDNP